MTGQQRQHEVEHLLFQERQWKEREGETDEFDWWREGADIYRGLLAHEPDSAAYKEKLAGVLVELGRDLKVGRQNYREARRIFAELTRIDEEHAMAHYRLGFLDVHDREWHAAIQHFRRALRIDQRSNGPHGLQPEHKVKALRAMAAAHYELSRQSLRQAREMYEEIDDPELADYLDGLLERTESEVAGGSAVLATSPYVLYSSTQGIVPVSEEELDAFTGYDTVSQGGVLLDMTGNARYWLITPNEKRLSVTVNKAQLLQRLIWAGGPVTSFALWKDVFEAYTFKTLHKNVNELRNQLESFLSIPRMDIVQTVHNGYRWNWPGESRVFCRREHTM